MIRALMHAGFHLSGARDARLMRGLAWAAAEGVLAALPYFLLYDLLRDVMLGRAAPARMLFIALAMAACLALRMLAGRRSLPLIFTGAYAMMAQARLRVADHLRRLPMGWFAGQRAGDLGGRLTADLELVENLWSHFLGVFVSGLVTPVCLLLLLCWIDARLALVALLGLPLALGALAWTQHAMSASAARLLAAGADAQSALLEYVRGIAVIRSFGRFGQAWQGLTATLARHHDAMLAAEVRPSPWLAAYGFTLEAGYASLLIAGALSLANGRLEASDLLALLILALPMYRHLFDAGLSTMLLRFARQALARIDAILAEAPMVEPTHARTPQGHDYELDQLCFAYPNGALAVDHISCRIPGSGLTAVVGPSGAGKSTLVHLLARLWEPDGGSIRLGGVDLREIGTQALHQRIAMVFQDIVVFSGSVRDNLLMGRPDAAEEEVILAARRARAHDFIMKLPQGYDTRLEEGGASLSGGERQRLSIARALLKDAPILLLDEATASVDPSAEADIQRALVEAAQGRTVVAIAHRLHSIRHADHILVMSQGRLVEQGRHDELLVANGLYARLWARQQAGRAWTLTSDTARGPSGKPAKEAGLTAPRL